MRFIFTNDDIGGTDNPQHIRWFEEVCAWLEGMGIPGTFFWVPFAGGKPGYEKKDLMKAVERAKTRGHDFQLHGLRHDTCLEFGLPSKNSTILNTKVLNEYESNRKKWEKEHTVERLGEKINTGVKIYKQAFGRKPLVFRSPCFGMCGEAYKALAGAGIKYSSSRGINPLATAYTATKNPEHRMWDPDFRLPAEFEGVLEMGCMEDLVIFGLPENEYADRIDLFKSEMKNYIRELGDRGTGIFGSHYWAMMSAWDRVRPLYEELFSWLRSIGVSGWTTFSKSLK